MKTKIIILLLFFAANTVDAQYSGWMGKKFVIQYTPTGGEGGLLDGGNNGFYNYADYYDRSSDNSYAEKIEENVLGYVARRYSIRHDVQVDYLLSRNQNIGVFVGTHRTGMDKIDVFNPINGEIMNVISQNITGYNIGLQYKYFFGNAFTGKSLSPIGRYFEFRLFTSRNKIKQRDSKNFNPNPENLVVNTYNRPGISIAFGKQRIIGKNILFNFGTELGTLIPDSDDGYDLDTNNPYGRLVSYSLFRIKMGIGLAAF